jgi:hypothetical protein
MALCGSGPPMDSIDSMESISNPISLNPEIPPAWAIIIFNPYTSVQTQSLGGTFSGLSRFEYSTNQFVNYKSANPIAVNNVRKIRMEKYGWPRMTAFGTSMKTTDHSALHKKSG